MVIPTVGKAVHFLLGLKPEVSLEKLDEERMVFKEAHSYQY